MKNKLVTILIIVLSLAAFGDLALAQTQKNPNAYPPEYNYYTAKSAQVYYAGKVDTISPSGIKLGGASWISLVITNNDTMKADVSFGYKWRGSTGWNLGVITDTVVTVAADSTEIKVRVPGSDRLGRMDVLLRAIITQRATSASSDSSQVFNATWIWKP